MTLPNSGRVASEEQARPAPPNTMYQIRIRDGIQLSDRFVRVPLDRLLELVAEAGRMGRCIKEHYVSESGEAIGVTVDGDIIAMPWEPR